MTKLLRPPLANPFIPDCINLHLVIRSALVFRCAALAIAREPWHQIHLLPYNPNTIWSFRVSDDVPIAFELQSRVT